MNIIWIDDDVDIIDAVVSRLSDHDFTRIRTIREALRVVEDLQACDLILLDMILPPGDLEYDYGHYSGLTLLRTLREEHEITAPVVAFSVVDPDKIRDEIESLGVTSYVRKPAMPTELEKAVREALGQ